MTLSRRTILTLAGAGALPIPASRADDKPSDFGALTKRWLDGMLALGPVNATALGDHRHDADLDDMSPAGRAAASAFSNRILADLHKIDSARLSRAEQVDAKIL